MILFILYIQNELQSKAVAERIIEISKTIYKVDAQVIGRVEERRTGTGATVIERPPLTIRSPHGHFTYSK